MSRILNLAMVVVAAASLGGCAIEQKGEDAASQSQAMCTTCTSSSGDTTTSGGTTGGSTSLTKWYARAYVTSPSCPTTGLLVAPQADVMAVSPETQKVNYPIGPAILTSGGYMYSLLATRDTGLTRPTKVAYGKQTGNLASIIEINGVKKTSAMYVCVYGADSSAMVTAAQQLADPIYIVSDPVWYAPPSSNYYKADIVDRVYWAGVYDPGTGTYTTTDELGVGYYYVTAGTAGPFFNSPNGYMRNQAGAGTQRYGVVVNGYVAISVYRSDAIKVGVSTYKPENNGGIGVWAPPVKTATLDSFTNQ